MYTKIDETLYAAALMENKTIAGDKSKASVADLVTKILGPLDKVQNQTIKDALLALNGTVKSCVALIDTFNVRTYSDSAYYIVMRNLLATRFFGQFQTTFASFLSTIASSVTDASMNMSKVADCQKAAYATIDGVIKDASARCDKGYMDFTGDGAKTFVSEVNKVYAAIQQCASKSLNNVTYCMKNNKISDAKEMDSTTNCTRDSFKTCLTWVSI